MQTNLADFIKDTPEGQEAEEILRACVHCGFCLAVCPTYQLLGDELDSPRGRIYLMKQVLEGAPVTKRRSCISIVVLPGACETVCPSGVRYGRLVDIGRDIVEKVQRDSSSAVMVCVAPGVAKPGIFKALLKLGRAAPPVSTAPPVSRVDASIRATQSAVLTGLPRVTLADGYLTVAFSRLWRLTSMPRLHAYWIASASR
jgi:glycolate oxidase iron-sulfur subunit